MCFSVVFFYKEFAFQCNTHEEEIFTEHFGGRRQHGEETFMLPSRVGTLFLSYTAALERDGENKDSEIRHSSCIIHMGKI